MITAGGFNNAFIYMYNNKMNYDSDTLFWIKYLHGFQGMEPLPYRISSIIKLW